METMTKILLLCCLLSTTTANPFRFPDQQDEEDSSLQDGIKFPGTEVEDDDSPLPQDFIRFLGSQDDIPMEDFSPLVQDFIGFLDNTTIEDGIATVQDQSPVAQQVESESQVSSRHGWSKPTYNVWYNKPWYPWWKKFASKKPSKPWWTKPSTTSKPLWNKPSTTSKPWWTKPTTVKSSTSSKPWWDKPNNGMPPTTSNPWFTRPTTTKTPTTYKPEWSKPTTAKPSPTSKPTSPNSGFGGKIVGLYLLLADETINAYTSDVNWQPRLHRYQQTGANVLFFTFIHPETMKVPISFKNLAATRGTNQEGAIPQSTKVIFAIGGIGYSLSVNPWDWLTSKAKAEAMAVKVARWKKQYNIDGIDLDIENGAGDRPEAGKHMIHFIKKIREIEPSMIISQPTFGFPQIPANNEVINAGWSKDGRSRGLVDSVGIMLYQGTQSLRYVDNYGEGKHGITARVPRDKILVGADGCATQATLQELARACVDQDLGGIMVWASSVKKGSGDGLKYGCTAKNGDDTARGLDKALEMLTLSFYDP